MKRPHPLAYLLCLLLACQTEDSAPNYNFVQEGKASYYANSLAGQKTASGAIYHPDSLTAAHKHLPLGTQILVINTANDRQISLKVNDRGPYHQERILDVSEKAADSLSFKEEGIVEVIIKADLPDPIADSLNLMLK